MPIIRYLHSNDMLAGVVLPASVTNLIGEIRTNTGTSVDVLIAEMPRDNVKLADWLAYINADVCIVSGFPYKIPISMLVLPRLGFYNIHYSLLPKYRGGAPVFWAIKNGAEKSGVTIHKMTEDLDGGAIVLQNELFIMPGEHLGLYNSRLDALAASMLPQLLYKLMHNEMLECEQEEENSTYQYKPTQQDLTINWESQTAYQVECLINACNPTYGGAITWLNGQQVRIIEVSPAMINGAQFITPGAIAYADANQGLFVACTDNSFLRINVVATNEGVISGTKLVTLGLNVSHKFESIIKTENSPIIFS